MSKSTTIPGVARRAAFSAKFESLDEKSACFREFGKRDNAGRLTLTAAERDALIPAYDLIG